MSNNNLNPDNIRTAGHESMRMFSQTAHTLLDSFMGGSLSTGTNTQSQTQTNNSSNSGGSIQKISEYYISANENNFTYYFFMPGVLKENSSVKVTNGKLVVSGKTNFPQNTIKDIYYLRTLNLPNDIHINDISATLNNGVFEINLPKKNENIEIAVN